MKKKKPRTLEGNLAFIQHEIDNYVPTTKWEAANDRTLKRLYMRRKALMRAMDKKYGGNW